MRLRDKNRKRLLFESAFEVKRLCGVFSFEEVSALLCEREQREGRMDRMGWLVCVWDNLTNVHFMGQ